MPLTAYLIINILFYDKKLTQSFYKKLNFLFTVIKLKNILRYLFHLHFYFLICFCLKFLLYS